MSQEEIDRMVREAEEFAEQDDAQRKRVEALNSLSAYVFSLKTQLGDQEGLGGKVCVVFIKSITRFAYCVVE